MLEMEIKRGWYKNIEGDKLEELMHQSFGSITKEGDTLVAHYGAMQPIKVWVKDKSTLIVDITTDKNADENTTVSTLKAKNKFLEAATGFDAKTRSKRLQKKAKEGAI